MSFTQPIADIIQQRFSCRTCRDEPIADPLRLQLQDALSDSRTGPFGTGVRLELLTATERDRNALKGLGTYGFIKGASGFIVGAVRRADKDMEDLGYLMERAVLLATDLGLGTCWLGGSFTRSRFAARISLRDTESLPAVVSVGYIADRRRLIDGVMRRAAGSDKRRPWDDLFFSGQFGQPLSRVEAGDYALPLDMVRLAPSASNKQPWRIVHSGRAWHFFLQRTPGYGKLTSGAITGGDLQRIDIGIAMCHFELSARDLGLEGQWQVDEPDVRRLDALTEYVATWF